MTHTRSKPANRAARARCTVIAASTLLLATWLGGCAAPKRGLLRFAGDQKDALVTIDDEYVGKLGRLQRRGIKLPVGEHRVTIEKVGFFPFDQLIIIHAEQRQDMKVELTEIPD